MQQEEQAEHREDAADDADDRALDQRVDLLGDLGLGELDLLADQDLRPLGHLLDRLPDLDVRASLGLLARAQLLGADRHAQSPPRRLRMNAARTPPAKAAPTRISGRSGGMPNGSSLPSPPAEAATLPSGCV